jgi:phosphate-selective porin
MNLKHERIKEGESGAGIRVQMRMRTRMKRKVTDDVDLKDIRLWTEDMIEWKQCRSRKSGLEKLWQSRRWRPI